MGQIPRSTERMSSISNIFNNLSLTLLRSLLYRDHKYNDDRCTFYFISFQSRRKLQKSPVPFS